MGDHQVQNSLQPKKKKFKSSYEEAKKQRKLVPKPKTHI
jgi:hypothetical protein